MFYESWRIRTILTTIPADALSESLVFVFAHRNVAITDSVYKGVWKKIATEHSSEAAGFTKIICENNQSSIGACFCSKLNCWRMIT
jgi:hypothetical protein